MPRIFPYFFVLLNLFFVVLFTNWIPKIYIWRNYLLMFLTYQFLFYPVAGQNPRYNYCYIVINISNNNCFPVIFLFVCLFICALVILCTCFFMFLMQVFLLDCSRSQRDCIYHISSNLSLIVGRNEPFCAFLI